MTKRILFKYTIFAIVGKVRVYIFNMAEQQDEGQGRGQRGWEHLRNPKRNWRSAASFRMLPSRSGV